MNATTTQRNEANTDLNTDGFQDCCPVHGSPLKAEYDFGAYRDATVYTFDGCRCAVSANCEAQILDGSTQYHASYGEATGRARLIVAQNDVADKPFR